MTDSQVVHVIDDDADVRQSLAFLLGTAGFAVRVHDSAVAFLAAPESGFLTAQVLTVDGAARPRRRSSCAAEALGGPDVLSEANIGKGPAYVGESPPARDTDAPAAKTSPESRCCGS